MNEQESEAANKQNTLDRQAVEAKRESNLGQRVIASSTPRTPAPTPKAPEPKPKAPELNPKVRFSGAKMFSGLFHCKANTIFGTEVRGDIQQNEPVTDEGLFRSFQAHYPGAVHEGFNFVKVADEHRSYNQIKADREAQAAKELRDAELQQAQADEKAREKINAGIKEQHAAELKRQEQQNQ